MSELLEDGDLLLEPGEHEHARVREKKDGQPNTFKSDDEAWALLAQSEGQMGLTHLSSI